MTLSPEMKAKVDALLAASYERVLKGIQSNDATPDLAWLKEQPADVVRAAISDCMPYGWKGITGKFEESLSDDQCAMALGAMVAIFVTAHSLTQTTKGK